MTVSVENWLVFVRSKNVFCLFLFWSFLQQYTCMWVLYFHKNLCFVYYKRLAADRGPNSAYVSFRPNIYVRHPAVVTSLYPTLYQRCKSSTLTTSHTQPITCHTFGSSHVFQLLAALANQRPGGRSQDRGCQPKLDDVGDVTGETTPSTTKYGLVGVTRISFCPVFSVIKQQSRI